jgi:hypothetical protein
MGNQQSTSTAISDVVNKSMTNVLISNSSTCGQNNSSVQELSFDNIEAGDGCSLSFNNISQTTSQTPNFTCSSQSQNETELLNKFKTELEQQASAAVSGLGGALNSEATSNTISMVRNEIENNINISNTSTCVQNNVSEQLLNFSKIKTSCPAYCRNPSLCKGVEKLCDMDKCETDFSNISQSITQAAVANCLSSNSTITKIINDAANDISQTAESKNTGIDLFASLASFGSSLIPLIIGVVVLVVIIILSTLMK